MATTPEQVVEAAFAEGCRDPEVAATFALALAAAGRVADLEEARLVCAASLVGREESSDDACRSVRVRIADPGGRIHRLNTATARHHPARPRRVRPPRFLRVA